MFPRDKMSTHLCSFANALSSSCVAFPHPFHLLSCHKAFKGSSKDYLSYKVFPAVPPGRELTLLNSLCTFSLLWPRGWPLNLCHTYRTSSSLLPPPPLPPPPRRGSTQGLYPARIQPPWQSWGPAPNPSTQQLMSQLQRNARGRK